MVEMARMDAMVRIVTLQLVVVAMITATATRLPTVTNQMNTSEGIHEK